MERERKGRERGLGFVTWGGVYCKSALRGFFYKNDRILEFFLLLVEIKISWRVYFVKILTWVEMFGAYLQFVDNRRSFFAKCPKQGLLDTHHLFSVGCGGESTRQQLLTILTSI